MPRETSSLGARHERWPKPDSKAHNALKILLAHGPLTEHGVWFHSPHRSTGQFYAPLRALENAGLVEVLAGPGKTRWAITAAGRERLQGGPSHG